MSAFLTRTVLRHVDSSIFHGPGATAAIAATVLLVALLVELQFLSAVDRDGTARWRRSLGTAVPPLVVVLAVVLAVRLVALLGAR